MAKLERPNLPNSLTILRVLLLPFVHTPYLKMVAMTQPGELSLGHCFS
jgi:phosphatidylglycerophosphate synthase